MVWWVGAVRWWSGVVGWGGEVVEWCGGLGRSDVAVVGPLFAVESVCCAVLSVPSPSLQGSTVWPFHHAANSLRHLIQLPDGDLNN